jgi:hypothetical protein
MQISQIGASATTTSTAQRRAVDPERGADIEYSNARSLLLEIAIMPYVPGVGVLRQFRGALAVPGAAIMRYDPCITGRKLLAGISPGAGHDPQS